MEDVILQFGFTTVDIEDDWLLIYDDENQIMLRPEQFKKVLESISYYVKKPLPDFLIEDHNGNIVTGCTGGTDVTKEWNNYLNNK